MARHDTAPVNAETTAPFALTSVALGVLF